MNQIIKRKEIAADILGEIHWMDDSFGYCRCPGIQHHSGKNHRQDCRVYVDQVPTVDCFHESCQCQIQDANRQLRSAIGKMETQSGTSPLRIPQARIDPEREELIHKANYLRLRLQANHGWSLSEIKAASNPPEHPICQRIKHLLLFESADRLWNGHTYESGQPHHGERFKTTAEWLMDCQLDERGVYRPNECLPMFREFTVPSAFRPGSFSRTKENVLHPRFLVVESDTLSKDEVGAVFRWLDGFVTLRMIVDTGGKSLHGWFEYPAPELLEQLRVILPILGCDRKMFNPAQPCRMPGVVRHETGKLQRIIYLKGGA